jgi:hypothetical protein
MLTNGVDRMFHLEVLALDTHVVALIKGVEDFLGLNGLFSNVFVDLRDISWENDFDILKLGEEQF